MAPATLSAIDALAAWASIRNPEPDAPEHAMTIREYAGRYGLKRKTASEQIRNLMLRGKLQNGFKWGVDSVGRQIKIPCYWPK